MMGGLGGLAKRQHSSAIATPSIALKSKVPMLRSAAPSATSPSSASKGSHSRAALRVYPAMQPAHNTPSWPVRQAESAPPRHASGVSHAHTRVTLALVSSTGAPAQWPGSTPVTLPLASTAPTTPSSQSMPYGEVLLTSPS